MKKEETMAGGYTILPKIAVAFGVLVLLIGLLFLVLVHPVPGVVCLLLAAFYFPPLSHLLGKRFGPLAPALVKIVLALAVIWFTLGVSDLGDMID